MTSILDVLTNPDQFFEKRMGKDIDLRIPAAIILVVGLVGAASAFIMLQKVIAGLPEEAASFASIGGIVGAFSAIVVAFIQWLLYAGIFYLISSAFSGEGPFKRVLEFVAYGFIPTIVGSLISLVAMIQAFPAIEFSIDNPELLQEMILSNPLIQASSIIGIIFTIWSANIWIFALLHARNLSSKHALLTVGIPIGLFIAYSVYNLIGTLT
ncbi:MAG: YIP1 family protein [Methanosarcinaceae archaeon]|nr:YIP1 family protein [Methanosarcinaceae archaeon]